MTNYPITDPAEIAKLPPAVYQTGLGVMCLSDDGVWTDFAGDHWSHADLASYDGIAARLVPEQDWPPVMDDMIEEVKALQTPRDRAVELLREVLLQSNDDWWYKDMRERIQAFLARHDSPREVAKDASGNWITRPLAEQEEDGMSCQRCGDDKLVMAPTEPDGEPGGVPCPDCAGGAS